MKKTIIAMLVLFLICALTAVISLFACGVEVIKGAVDYGVEQYHEYRNDNIRQTVFDGDFSGYDI